MVKMTFTNSAFSAKKNDRCVSLIYFRSGLS